MASLSTKEPFLLSLKIHKSFRTKLKTAETSIAKAREIAGGIASEERTKTPSLRIVPSPR